MRTSSDLSRITGKMAAGVGSAFEPKPHGLSEATMTRVAKKDGLSTTAKHATKARIADGPLIRSAVDNRCLVIEILSMKRWSSNSRRGRNTTPTHQQVDQSSSQGRQICVSERNGWRQVESDKVYDVEALRRGPERPQGHAARHLNGHPAKTGKRRQLSDFAASSALRLGNVSAGL